MYKYIGVCGTLPPDQQLKTHRHHHHLGRYRVFRGCCCSYYCSNAAAMYIAWMQSTTGGTVQQRWVAGVVRTHQIMGLPPGGTGRDSEPELSIAIAPLPVGVGLVDHHHLRGVVQL